MISLLAILWTLLIGTTVAESMTLGGDCSPVEQVSTQTIHHSGFSSEDRRQAAVQYAYDLGGIDFVLMLECENGNRNPEARWDHGHAWGLCQMNDRYHNIPSGYYGNRQFQLDYCYQKWSTGTKFYWPQRKIKWQACKEFVRKRFILE